MTSFPLPSDAALAILAKLSAGPSKSERLAQMQIDARSADLSSRQLQERNLAEMTSRMSRTAGRTSAGRDRAAERQEDREFAFEMLQRRQDFAREEARTKQASSMQEAGMRMRGAGMRPGQPRPEPRPTQRAIVTGPEGMLMSQSGGPTERVEGLEAQIAAAQGMGQDVQFRRRDGEFQPRLVQGDQPTFARVSGAQAQPDALSSIIMDSSMSETDKVEMSRAAGSVGQRGGLTVNQFLEQIESREPVRLSADQYRAKRDRAIIALSRMEDTRSPEARMLAESIDYYETKMMERPAPRWNPSAYRTVDPGPSVEPSDEDIQALLDQGLDDAEIARRLRGS